MNHDTAHAWWSRLRHQGLLLSPVVLLERYPSAPQPAPFFQNAKLRDAYTRFMSKTDSRQDVPELEQSAILGWVDALLENYLGHRHGRIAKQGNIPEKLTAVVRIGTKSDTIRPHRVVFADEAGQVPALLVMADTSPMIGRGRGRTAYSRFLELLRGTGHRLGLLTNGQQFRLVYAGLDFESWCEWESERWFDDGEGSEELAGLRQLLSTESLKPIKETSSGLLDGVEESRKRQADLSSVLRENVRLAVELLLEEVSSANRTNQQLFAELVAGPSNQPLTDAEAHEALLQATVRIVMRLVVCLFAESRQLLPVNDPVYASSYGVRALYELLEEAVRNEGGTHGLMNRQMAWPRLMALFRLIHRGSSHGGFTLRSYGGALFRPGEDTSHEAVARALHILEHAVQVCDATIYHVLRKLLRGPLPVIKGKAKTFVEGPVDYTDLRTEFIGLIYEGLLDYKLKRTDEKIGPQIFLNLGREPVLPLSRLEDMLANDKKGLKDLLTTLRKENVTASAGEEESEEESTEETEEVTEETTDAEVEAEPVAAEEAGLHAADYLDAVESAKSWAKEAVVLAGLVGKQKAKEPNSEYQARIEAEANRLIKRVVATGEFYLVRAGNTRKGTGTFYTRPQLAVPTVHRTLEPLCYTKADDGTLTPKEPEAILGLKVCDPACGSASFLVAALHYLADALFRSLCHHRKLTEPAHAKKLTLPYGRPSVGKTNEQLVPFPPNDPQRGDTFAERITALLRRHVVERCIYGVDINALAVEFARVSLWVETLDPELPFTFLDHKIKVGNSLVGCWLDRVLDYPLKAWEREGGDGKDGPRTQRIETFLKGEKKGNKRSGDGRIKQEMRALIERRFQGQGSLFDDQQATPETVVAEARSEYEKLHDFPPDADPDVREQFFRDKIEGSPAVQALRRAMDEWCAVWFWPSDEGTMPKVPTPDNFHADDAERREIIRHLATEIKFFHWELAFPDVFTPQRQGFDALLGNPPWENLQPNPYEFFSEHDPIVRTFGRITLLRRITELFHSIPELESKWVSHCGFFNSISNWIANSSDPFGLDQESSVLGRGTSGLISTWKTKRASRAGAVGAKTPFRFQIGRVFTYKLFLELSYFLLNQFGRLGMIVPSGLYSDSWSRPLRELFLNKSTWEWLFCFENRKKIFDIHGSFKFAPIIVDRQTTKSVLKAAFMIHDLQDWESSTPPVLNYDRSLIPLFSPKSMSLAEVRTQRDLTICQRVYEHSVRIGDKAPGWEITFALEFMMNTDAKLFPPRQKWESQGYIPDVFGRWIGPNGGIALPLYQGSMILQMDPIYQAFNVDGRGRWATLAYDSKQFLPKFLMLDTTFHQKGRSIACPRLLFRDIARPTDQRTMIAAITPDFPAGNKTPILEIQNGDLAPTLALSAFLSCFTFDFITRNRVAATSLNWFIVEELPIPKLGSNRTPVFLLALLASRLNFIHRRFAPEWLRLKHLYPALAQKEWKHWWAVTEADRLRLRVEIDALCADLYGLDPDDFDWIVRDDPTDPKGFYRVDRNLPFRERLTGLAATAFRALKEGKWSAESAATLTNDEFFALLGIPEMTTGPDPLIKKREGCHRWKPEEFGPDDPRHGWTWDHCCQDAVALLGSEQAVREYVEGKQEKADDKAAENDGATDLFGHPLPPKQGTLF